jgi:hypothetical protein
LTGVDLLVFVDRDLQNYALLEREITAKAEAALSRDGDLAAEGPEGLWLSIKILTYRTTRSLEPGDLIVLVRVELHEQVLLKRSPALKIPGGGGAVTWVDQSIGLVSGTDLKESILKDVDWLVGSFASDVKSVSK